MRRTLPTTAGTPTTRHPPRPLHGPLIGRPATPHRRSSTCPLPAGAPAHRRYRTRTRERPLPTHRLDGSLPDEAGPGTFATEPSPPPPARPGRGDGPSDAPYPPQRRLSRTDRRRTLVGAWKTYADRTDDTGRVATTHHRLRPTARAPRRRRRVINSAITQEPGTLTDTNALAKNPWHPLGGAPTRTVCDPERPVRGRARPLRPPPRPDPRHPGATPPRRPSPPWPNGPWTTSPPPTSTPSADRRTRNTP